MSVDSLEVVGRKEVLYFVQFVIETRASNTLCIQFDKTKHTWINAET